jgi:hypothetical protein
VQVFSNVSTGVRRLVLAVVAVSTLLGLQVASAAAADVAPAGQYQGPSFAGGPSSPTGSKPESKLWFADGTWWSVMNVGGTGLRIYRLDPSSQAWQATGVVVDSRNTVRSDVLWDGSQLYVATHVFTESAATGGQSNLYRFSYDAGSDRYTLDPGFPATINTWKTETLVIAKDSSGQLWATWTQESSVFVNRTLVPGADSVWGSPFALPGGGGLSSDDISSVISYSNRIGIMWSDQNDDQMRFASHDDGAIDDTAFGPFEVAVSGTNMADDHINLKADAGGRVYAATKTSVGTSTEPFMLLDVRDTSGHWTTTVFGTKADNHTRPILLLDEQKRRLYYFATWDQSGDVIYMKETSMDDPSFEPGRGTKVIDAPDVNNATSTKQSISSATGLVVQASADATDLYWHYWNPLSK